MPPETDLLLALAIFIGATLYSSVGHGGSSAYIALMALFGVPAAMIRPTALVLNLVVSSLASVRYIRAGQFRWRTLWPFLFGALPMAYVGGGIVLPGHVYRPLLGCILWLSAMRLLWPRELQAVTKWRDPAIPAAILAGAGIGMLSGLTGTGGGIFLSPLLLFMAWSEPKAASGVAAVFILANSAAGLLGNISSLHELPSNLLLFAGAALVGGLAGTTLGIRLPVRLVLRSLALVLLVAGAKLIGVY
ncbi:MAG: sulfite exporter TauE/SafE family protein [Sandarakinorhabdus sp.]|nr:sulfite exporter TauE/SafE family protein [Sandarakinorhabdus sp.]